MWQGQNPYLLRSLSLAYFRIESTMPGCSGPNYVPRSCLNYQLAAGYFLNLNQVRVMSVCRGSQF